MAVGEEQLNLSDECFKLDTLKCKGDTDIMKIIMSNLVFQRAVAASQPALNSEMPEFPKNAPKEHFSNRLL